MKNAPLYSRRQMISCTAALTGLLALRPWGEALGVPKKRAYRIGACDWSLNQGSAVQALAVAKDIGLDGVQVASLAIGELNRIPYKSAPETEAWVSDSIGVAEAMGCKVILLAFFDKGDLKGDPAGQQEVVARLKRVAAKAERAGVILGIESWLSAAEHLDMIQAIGSKNVQVYYDVANSHKMGYDIYQEMAMLGRKYICEVHAKENNSLLGQGAIDFARVRQALDAIGYAGWVHIEGARQKDSDLLTDYRANQQFLRTTLNG